MLAILIAFRANSRPTTSGAPGDRDEAEGADHFAVGLENARDGGDAVAKALVTDVTLGGAHSRAREGCVFTVTFHRAGQPPTTKVYRHTVHLTIDNASRHACPRIGLSEAVSRIVEHLILDLLVDLQREERR